jgi:hypothetical protein
MSWKRRTMGLTGESLIDDGVIGFDTTYSSSKIEEKMSPIETLSVHDNRSCIDKFEETGGRPLYDGSPLAFFNDAPVISTNSNSYVIDLITYGIIEGFPAKPYLNTDYVNADNNIQGINNALQWAYNNGYTEVILPRGDYAVCYPRSINLVSHMTFNLNGSTLKVIYDSDTKSPFDSRTTDDYYKFQGTVMFFDNVTNAHLTGGSIIGCRADRSYSNSTEESKLESSYGIQFKRTASHNTITNCSIGAFTGDSINFISSALSELIEFNQQYSLNNINNATGELTASTNTITSILYDLPILSSEYTSLVLAGTGYNRTIGGLNSKDFDMAFYRSDNSFIGKMKNQKIYTPVSIPNGAAKFRLVIYDETNPSKVFDIRVTYGDIPNHNIIRNCDIYGCQRGGIQGGGSHNIIEYNTIRDTGKDGNNSFLDGGTVFYDPTRYGFNQEDSYGDGVIIRHNNFYGGTNGILAGVYTINIENNHFYNMSGLAINVYSVQHATISGNYIYNCGRNIGLMETYFKNSFINITGNYIKGGTMLPLSSSQYKVSFTNNFLLDVNNISFSSSESHIFQNNIIKYATVAPSYAISVDSIKDSIFESSIPGQRLDAKVYNFEGCTFSNIVLSVKTRNESTISEEVSIYSCLFKNSAQLLHDVSATKPKIVNVHRSKFVDSTIKNQITNLLNVHSITTLKKCSIEANTSTNILHTQVNSGKSTIQLEDCNIIIKNPSFVRILSQLWQTNLTINIFLKRCNVSYTGGQAPLALVYYQTLSTMSSFISADNTFTNITLPNADSIYIGYDPLTKSNEEPTIGFFRIGDIRHNISPTVGQHIGYVCMSEGYATRTQWAPNKSFLIGDRIYEGTHVYEIIAAGTSTNTKPSFLTAIIDDNIGITEWQASTSYATNDMVMPSTPNGFYYVCTIPGETGATPPTWATNGSNITDGTTTWIGKRLVTWKRVGSKATFSPYGLISN